MTDDLDPLLASIARLDSSADAPPERGSSRYESILEHAMTTTHPTTHDEREAPQNADGPRPDLARSRRWRRVAGVAVAAAAVAIGAIVVLEPGQEPTKASASEVIRSAAATTGEVRSLRSAGTYDGGGEPPTHMTSEIDGADYQTTFRRTLEDGTVHESTTTLIGTTRWDDEDGETTSYESPPEQNNAPFPEASQAVIEAALKGSKVTDLGTEEVRGQEATRYRITLTPASIAALSALSPRELARFELEYPQGVVALEVWVADDLIRRIDLRSDWETGAGTSIEFYDFGADIDIQPPN